MNRQGLAEVIRDTGITSIPAVDSERAPSSLAKAEHRRIRSGVVFMAVGHILFITYDFPSAEQAAGLAHDPDLQAGMAQAGVEGAPDRDLHGCLNRTARRGGGRAAAPPPPRLAWSGWIPVSRTSIPTATPLLPGIHTLERSIASALSPDERACLLNLLGKILSRTAAVAAEDPDPLNGRASSGPPGSTANRNAPSQQVRFGQPVRHDGRQHRRDAHT